MKHELLWRFEVSGCAATQKQIWMSHKAALRWCDAYLLLGNARFSKTRAGQKTAEGGYGEICPGGLHLTLHTRRSKLGPPVNPKSELAGVFDREGSQPMGTPHLATASASALPPIQCIVVLMLENRSFDRVFGTWPSVSGLTQGPFSNRPNPAAIAGSANTPIAAGQPALPSYQVNANLPVSIDSGKVRRGVRDIAM